MEDCDALEGNFGADYMHWRKAKIMAKVIERRLIYHD